MPVLAIRLVIFDIRLETKNQSAQNGQIANDYCVQQGQKQYESTPHSKWYHTCRNEHLFSPDTLLCQLAGPASRQHAQVGSVRCSVSEFSLFSYRGLGEEVKVSPLQREPPASPCLQSLQSLSLHACRLSWHIVE